MTILKATLASLGEIRSKSLLERAVVFSLYWGFGENLAEESKKRLEKMLAELFSPENVKKDMSRYFLSSAKVEG